MKKYVIMMMIIITCSILGVITAVIVTNLYSDGIIFDELITGTISISDLQFIVWFAWTLMGVIIGVLKS